MERVFRVVLHLENNKFKRSFRVSSFSLYFTFLQMSNQFIPEEEEHPLDWLKQSSHLTYNNHSPFSELSKDHFLDDLLKPTHLAVQSNHHRSRSKVNSKNYRDKKKGQAEQMKKQVERLQKENEFLKMQRYCRWCQRSFEPPVILQKEGIELSSFQKRPSFFQKEEAFEVEAQFQKPKFIEKEREERRGKVWVALGMLMLILGLTIHGFDGNLTTVKEIEVHRTEVERWKQQLSSPGQEYLEVKMRIKDEQQTFGKVDTGQLKIVYKTEKKAGTQFPKEEKVSINKELLLGIQAELDDVGFYL